MAKSSRRWLVQAVLVAAVLGFLGFTVIPLYSVIQDNQSANTPAQTASPTGANQSQLQAQEQGYEAVLEREPDNQTALEGLLQIRLQKLQSGGGDIEEVISPLQKLAELNPERTEYQLLLAQAQQQTGRLEAASEKFQAILDQQPGNLDALRGWVSVQLQEQQPAAAIARLKDTLAMAEGSSTEIDASQVRLILAEVYGSQQQYADAIALYDQMIAANKQDFRPVLGKALTLRAQGNTQAAQSAFDDAIALAPEQLKAQLKQLATKPTRSQSPAAPDTNPASP